MTQMSNTVELRQPGALHPWVVRGALIALGCMALYLLFIYSGRDVSGTHIARPPGSYEPPRTEFLGISNWYYYFEFMAMAGFLVMWSFGIAQSRKIGKASPLLLMVASITVVSVLDPPMNWANYVSYDPRFFHFNVEWPWVNMEPTVQPWVAVWAYAGFYLIPAWVTLVLYKRWSKRAAPTDFLIRKPRLAILAISIPTCIIYDAMFEIPLVRSGLFSYVQSIPSLTLFLGKPWQFPLYEPIFYGLIMSPTAPLMWIDDKGRTWGEIFSSRYKIFRNRPSLGAFVMSTIVFSLVYIAFYFVPLTAIRASGLATGVATWRYPETSVYDPQDYQRKSGNPGPYYVGTLGGWERRIPIENEAGTE